MAFLRVSGTPNVQPFLKTASTALPANSLVKLSSGQLVASVADDVSVLGVCMESIASTDGDYATARPVLVDMLDEDAVIQGDITGTMVVGDVGKYFDIADNLHIDQTEGTALSAGATGTTGLFLFIGFISASVGLFMLSSPANVQPSNPTS
jgi:hypothetical protein